MLYLKAFYMYLELTILCVVCVIVFLHPSVYLVAAIDNVPIHNNYYKTCNSTVDIYTCNVCMYVHSCLHFVDFITNFDTIFKLETSV